MPVTHAAAPKKPSLSLKVLALQAGLVFFKLLLFLPLTLQFKLGGSLGVLFCKLAKSRRQVTYTNLKLCFPQASTEALQLMTTDVFRQIGITLFETLLTWYRPNVMKNQVTVVGSKRLSEDLKTRGVLVAAGHFTQIELGAFFGSSLATTAAIYRPQNSPELESIIYSNRSRYIDHQIPAKNALRPTVKALKDKQLVWYLPDQDFGLKNGVMSEFFGHSAATVTAARSMIKHSGAALYFAHICRVTEPGWFQKPEYQLSFIKHEDEFPTASKSSDVQLLNNYLEALINLAPTQYMWFHKRFKTQPNGPNPYGGYKHK